MPKTGTHSHPIAVTGGRHRSPGLNRSTQAMTAAVLAAVAAASIGTAAPALADTDGQGGFTAPGSGQGQGGFTSPGGGSGQGGFTTPAPAPAPSTRGSAIPTLPEETTPIVQAAPDASQAPAFYGPTGPVYYSPPQTYSQSYNAEPAVVLHAPRPTPPPRTILPPVGYIRIGNYITKKPAQLSNADAAAINQNAGVAEGKIAQFWESVGLPKDQAARRGAAAVTGGAAGAALGFVALGVPAAVIGGVGGGLIGAGVGAAIGAFVPPQPLNVGTGALIGAGSGAAIGVGAGLGVGVLGAIGGGIIGAVVGDQVGAGDPGADPNGKTITPGTQDERPYRADPPNPAGNQYEVHLDRTNLPGGGKVDYVVNKAGDVDASASIGPVKTPPVHISAAAADAPYKAAGLLAQTARDTVARGVADLSAQAEKAVPGLKVAFPQLAPPTKR